jgi:hypothetical protein
MPAQRTYSPISLKSSSSIPTVTSTTSPRNERPLSPFKPTLFKTLRRYRNLTRNRDQYVTLLPLLAGRQALQNFMMLDHLCRTIDNLEDQLTIQEDRALNLYLELTESKGGQALSQHLHTPIPFLHGSTTSRKLTPPASFILSSVSSTPSSQPLHIPPKLGSPGNPIIIEDSDDEETILICRLCGTHGHERYNCTQHVRFPEHPGLLFDKDFLEIPNDIIDSGVSRR